MWPWEQQRVAQARVASRVEPATAELVGEHVRVRFWITREHRLICRVINVRADGQYVREDIVTGEWLAIAKKRKPFFASLDAFRAHCGEPTMPLDQCPICSKLPERCSKEDDDERPEIELTALQLHPDFRLKIGVLLEHLGHQPFEVLHVPMQGVQRLG